LVELARFLEAEMRADRPSLIETLIDEEIRRVVADAIRDGGCLSSSATAVQIMKVYPTCGLSRRHLADRIVLAAAAAGVAVELDNDRAA
jgi:hypothetical protein